MFNYSPRLSLGATSDTRSPEEKVLEELQFLAQSLQMMSFAQLKELHVAPLRPRAGMIVLADGTDWNPGSGAGFYGYYGSAWNKLG